MCIGNLFKAPKVSMPAIPPAPAAPTPAPTISPVEPTGLTPIARRRAGKRVFREGGTSLGLISGGNTPSASTGGVGLPGIAR